MRGLVIVEYDVYEGGGIYLVGFGLLVLVVVVVSKCCWVGFLELRVYGIKIERGNVEM